MPELIFDSVTELIEKVHLKPSPANFGHHTSERFRSGNANPENVSRTKWIGEDVDLDGAMKIIAHGYPNGDRLIQKVLAEALPEIPKITSLRRRRTQGDFGDHIDIQRVYAGQLDRAWSKTRREPSTGITRPSKTLLIDVGGHCELRAEQLVWQGAYGAALADRYAEAGYNVEIWAVATSGRERAGEINRRMFTDKKNDGGCTVAVRLYDSSTPLDLSNLAATICFAGFYRILLFEAWLSINRPACGGLGGYNNLYMPDAFKAEDADFVGNVLSLDDIKADVHRRFKQEEVV